MKIQGGNTTVGGKVLVGRGSIVKDGLVWHMDPRVSGSYSAGNYWNDTIGTYEGTEVWSDSTRVGDAVKFGEIGNPKTYFSGNEKVVGNYIGSGDIEFTMEGWIYQTTFASYNPDVNIPDFTGAFSSYSAGVGMGPGIGIGSWTFPSSTSWYVGSSNGKIFSSGVATANTWTHIAYTRTFGGKLDLYINGVLDNSDIPSNDGIGVPSSNFIIGLADHFVYEQEFNGKLASLKIYNRKLSAYEIYNNYFEEQRGLELL